MARAVRRSVLPYDLDLLFDVAVDVERYPEFLPDCKSARVLRRDGDVLTCDNLYGWGPLTTRFRSRTTVTYPHDITVRSLDGFPVRFLLRWTFAPRDTGTEVGFEMELDLPGPGMKRIVRMLMDHKARDIETAFRRRVAEVARRRAADRGSGRPPGGSG